MQRRKIIRLFLILLSLLFFSTTQAGEPAVVVINSGEGKAGEILHTSIELRNVSSLESKGISGGELVLAFDAGSVDVEEIKKGALIGNDFLFIANSTFTENSIKVVWAALRGLIQEDGVLLNVSFELKESGSIELKVTDMILYDENVQPLHIDIRYNQDDSGEGEPVDITPRDPEETELKEGEGPTPGESNPSQPAKDPPGESDRSEPGGSSGDTAPPAESPGSNGSTGANNDSGNSTDKGGEEPQLQMPDNVSEERDQAELAGALNNREQSYASLTAIIVVCFLAAVIGGTSLYRNFKHSQ